MAGPPASPVTQQVGRTRGCGQQPEAAELREAARCRVVDADGRSIPFEALYGEQKAIVVFVRVRRERRPGAGVFRRPGARTGALWGCERGVYTKGAGAEGKENVKADQFCFRDLLFFGKMMQYLSERK